MPLDKTVLMGYNRLRAKARVCDFGHAKSSEAYWMIFDYQSGTHKSSEAY